MTVRGVAAAQAPLKLENDKGIAEVNLQVENQRLGVEGQGKTIEIYVGEQRDLAAQLLDADGNGIKDAILQVTADQPDKVLESDSLSTAADGTTIIPLRGAKSTGANPVTLTVRSPTDPNAVQHVRIVVKDVALRFVQAPGTIAKTKSKTVKVQAFDPATGGGVANIQLRYESSEPGIATVSGGFGSTDQKGEAVFDVTGVERGQSTITAHILGDPAKSANAVAKVADEIG